MAFLELVLTIDRFGLETMTQTRQHHRFAICVENLECDDLETGKVYQLVPDKKAAKEGYFRVIDESGEDYLYPESYLVTIELPKPAEDALLKSKASR